jgi:hypothetical protein
MTTRLTLILVAALASAPVVFAPAGLRVHVNSFAGWAAEHNETARVDLPSAHAGTDCVIAPNLRPHRVAGIAGMPSISPTELASGGSVACLRTAANGS